LPRSLRQRLGNKFSEGNSHRGNALGQRGQRTWAELLTLGGHGQQLGAAHNPLYVSNAMKTVEGVGGFGVKRKSLLLAVVARAVLATAFALALMLNVLQLQWSTPRTNLTTASLRTAPAGINRPTCAFRGCRRVRHNGRPTVRTFIFLSQPVRGLKP
jgi:hypothetical protein